MSLDKPESALTMKMLYFKQSPHDMPRETTREKQAKEVGRTLYEGILSSQSSVSLSTSNGTINSSMHRPDILSQDALEGLEDGKMSAVRRTFCLFVAFDLILTSVLWIIYTQLIGESSVWQAFRDQVENYKFELSLFDTVMASAFRFVLLLLTYALFRVRHWWPVAITTFITCVFLLVKCFLFKFSAEKAGSGNSLSYVLLIVPFVIAWVETWFIDFKVLPQEKKAVDALRYVTERTPLVRDEQGFYTQSQQAALDHNQYYSPVNTPDASEDEDEKGFHSARQSRTHSRSASRSSTVSAAEEDYLTSAAEAWDILWEQFRKEDWRLEAGTDPQQGCVKCRHQKGEGKLFMLQGVVEMAAENLFKELVYGINDSPSWNPTILESETLQEVDDCTCVQYSVSAEAAGGIISSRDFINVLRWGKRGSYYMSCGTATTHPDRPPGKKHVRGVNGAGGWVIRPIPGDPSSSEFFWINRTDLKGWLPQGVIDKAMSGFLLDFLKYLRKRVEKLKADGQV